MALTQISTKGIKDGTITGADLATNVDLVDNQKIRFGTGNDLEIFHDSSHSSIKNVTGNFSILSDTILLKNAANSESFIRCQNNGVEIYHSNSLKLGTYSGGLNLTGKLNASDDVDLSSAESNNSNTAQFKLSNFTIGQHQNVGSYRFANASTGSFLFTANNHNFFNKDVNKNILRLSTSAVEMYHDNVKKAETSATGFDVTGKLNVSGDIDIPDSSKLLIGTGDDLEIYHDGTDSILKDTRNSGNFRIQADSIGFNDKDVTETMLLATADGSVDLYFNGSKKFETNTSGAIVRSSSFATLEIRATSNDGVLKLTSNDDDTTDWTIHNDYSESNDFDVRFNNSRKMNLDTSGNLFIAGNLDLNDNDKLLLGNSDDLQIYHDGSNSYITDDGMLVIRGDGLQLQRPNGNLYVQCIASNAVKLFFDGSEKFATKSDGATISGSLYFPDSTVATGRAKFGASDDLQIHHDGNSHIESNSGNFQIGCTNNESIYIKTNNSNRWRFWYDGNFRPTDDNSYDIGSTSFRVRNIYIADLHLSNRDSSNDFDGTWGEWTIQEGESDLFLKNNRSGKKYKFNLTEVV